MSWSLGYFWCFYDSLWFMSNLIWQGKNCFSCVCHNGHQLFGIGFHFKIFRSQVATEKKVNFTPCYYWNSVCDRSSQLGTFLYFLTAVHDFYMYFSSTSSLLHWKRVEFSLSSCFFYWCQKNLFLMHILEQDIWKVQEWLLSNWKSQSLGLRLQNFNSTMSNSNASEKEKLSCVAAADIYWN